MNASKTNRKWMSVTGALLTFMAISLVCSILVLLPTLMRDFHLMRSGTVTRGTIVGIKTGGSCANSEGGARIYYDVQFIDNKGQTRVENVSECIGIWPVGDSIPILYAPDDPTVIAAQGRFTDQVQADEENFAVFAGVIPIGCALAILFLQLVLPQLRRYLMVHQKPGPTQGNWLISRIKKGNWLISRIKKSKIAVSFSKNILCRIGIHQGEWPTAPWPSRCYQQRRFCIFCGKPQYRERHDWPPVAFGEYLKDGSCEMRIRCLECGKTKLIVHHEGRKSWWNSSCRRCGEDLGGD